MVQTNQNNQINKKNQETNTKKKLPKTIKLQNKKKSTK
jgi:hypothetical protein